MGNQIKRFKNCNLADFKSRYVSAIQSRLSYLVATLNDLHIEYEYVTIEADIHGKTHLVEIGFYLPLLGKYVTLGSNSGVSMYQDAKTLKQISFEKKYPELDEFCNSNRFLIF